MSTLLAVLLSAILHAPLFSSPQAQVLIVYWSQNGHTKQVAQYVYKGAQEQSKGRYTITLKSVNDTTLDDIENASALALGAPVYYANIPKSFLPLFDQWHPDNPKLKGKLFTTFCTAGSYGAGAANTLTGIQQALKIYQGRFIPGNQWQDGLGLIVVTGVAFEHRKNQINKIDLKRAESLGKSLVSALSQSHP